MEGREVQRWKGRGRKGRRYRGGRGDTECDASPIKCVHAPAPLLTGLV